MPLIQGTDVHGHLKGAKGRVPHHDLDEQRRQPEQGMRQYKVIHIKETAEQPAIPILIKMWDRLSCLGAIWFFMLRADAAGGNKALSFARAVPRRSRCSRRRSLSKMWRVDEAKED